MPRNGRPPKHPLDLRQRVPILLPQELVVAMDAVVRRSGGTRTALIEQAVVEWLRKPQRTARRRTGRRFVVQTPVPPGRA